MEIISPGIKSEQVLPSVDQSVQDEMDQKQDAQNVKLIEFQQ